MSKPKDPDLFKAPPAAPRAPAMPIEPPPTNAHLDESGRLIHNKCALCDKDAPFGVGFFPRKGLLGMWYCASCWPGRLKSVNAETTPGSP